MDVNTLQHVEVNEDIAHDTDGIRMHCIDIDNKICTLQIFDNQLFVLLAISAIFAITLLEKFFH